MSPCCQFGGTIICTDIDWPGPKGGGKRMPAKKASKAAPKTLYVVDVMKRLAECIEDLEDLAWAEGHICGKEKAKLDLEEERVKMTGKTKVTPKKPKGKIGKAVKRK